jgi:preprotein translocase subunit SecA
MWEALRQLYPVQASLDDIIEECGGSVSGLSADLLTAELVSDAEQAYDKREEELGEEVTRELERRVILSVLDRKWREHLYEMDYLRDGIGLRAMAQRDPLIEYQREGFDLFTAMMDSIKEETVGYLFHVEVQVNPEVSEETAEAIDSLVDASAVSGIAPQIAAKGLAPERPQHLEYSAPDEDGGVVHGDIDTGEGAFIEVDANASRAERRRAERANRKLKS